MHSDDTHEKKFVVKINHYPDIHFHEMKMMHYLASKQVPGISTMVDQGATEGKYRNDKTYFMVLKRAGISIKDILQSSDQALKKTDVLKIGLKLLKIVEKLHDAGVIHCDIKPDNVLIGDIDDLVSNHKKYGESWNRSRSFID